MVTRQTQPLIQSAQVHLFFVLLWVCLRWEFALLEWIFGFLIGLLVLLFIEPLFSSTAYRSLLTLGCGFALLTIGKLISGVPSALYESLSSIFRSSRLSSRRIEIKVNFTHPVQETLFRLAIGSESLIYQVRKSKNWTPFSPVWVMETSTASVREEVFFITQKWIMRVNRVFPTPEESEVNDEC